MKLILGIVAAVALITVGVLWGVRGGEPVLLPPAPAGTSLPPVDSAALEKEIEELQAMRNHLLPPPPERNPYALRTEEKTGAAPQSAPPAAANPSYTYTAAPSGSAPPAGQGVAYVYPTQPTSSARSTYTYTYNYSSSGASPNIPPPNSTSTPPSPPPAPVFTAAPGTRAYTVTTDRRFCEYVKGSSAIFLSGYPFSQDIEVYNQDILQWSMTSVTFRLPFSFPTGAYAVIVRGYQKYGYCDDVRVGFIKVQ